MSQINMLKKAKASTHPTNISSKDQVVKETLKYVSGAQAEYIKSQLKLSGVPKLGRRFTTFDRSFALNLYQRSPRAYK